MYLYWEQGVTFREIWFIIVPIAGHDLISSNSPETAY